MICSGIKQRLDAWLDGELDPATSAEIEAHIAACPDCLAIRDKRNRVRETVRLGAPRYAASAALKQAVMQSSRHAAATTHINTAKSRLKSGGPSWWQTLGLVAVTAACSALVTLTVLRGLNGDGEINSRATELRHEQIVARHVIALARTSPVDVASSDQHVVKPWFQGKIDFAPAVRNLDAEGFVLRGARLDNLDGQQAVAVVYQIRQHPISLYVWRSKNDRDVPSHLDTARGFGVVTWQGGGLSYAAISDVEPQELERFAQNIQQAKRD